jgi:signal transduction histidine kinase
MPANPPPDQEGAPRLVATNLLEKSDSWPAPVRPAVGEVRRLWRICGLLVWTAFLAAAAVTWQLRESAFTTAERELTNLGIVLADQTSRTIQSVDLVLQEVQARASAPEEAHSQLEEEKTTQFLVSRLRNLPQADAIALIDASGKLLNWSRDQPTRSLDFSDRDYFAWLRDHDDPHAFIGLPVIGRVSGKQIMFIARRLNGPDGRFLGVVSGLIDTHYLESFYGTISMVPGESVTLLRRDGVVFAGHPDIEHRLGMHMPAKSPWYDRVTEAGGSYHSPGYLSDIKQIITVHPLHDYPLVVDVNMSEQAALRDWYRQAVGIGIATVTVGLGLMVLFGVIVAQFRRQEAQHAKLKAFAEMSVDWFWEQNSEFRFVRDPNITLAGRPTDAGKTRWDIADPAMSQERWEHHKADLAARRPFRDFHWERILQDGTRQYLSTSGEPIFDEDGAFAGYRGTGRDITADVEAKDELRRAKEKAETANRAKSVFLANMGHELRTPLHAIIGFSELIRDRTSGSISDSYVDWSGEILASGRHLLDVVNDVLELSRIEAGRYELTEDRAVIGTIVHACCGLMKQQAQAGHVRIDSAVGEVVLRADRQAVKQIILNLLSNAVKFTPPNGVVLIREEHGASGNYIILVADTGIGIDAAALASIGDPFTQADASKSRRYGGTGLGLAICRKLIALHGGDLTIESSPGNGTTVRVIFPAARIAAYKPSGIKQMAI